MDDLLIYIRALLLADADLQAAYLAAGASEVRVIPPTERATASYPCQVLEGEEGAQLSFGENANPKYFEGRVRLEIVTRTSVACPDALDTLRTIQARTRDLLLGNRSLSLDGIQGQAISAGQPLAPQVAGWNVPVFRQTSPTRMIPAMDPTIYRHLTTYAVTLNRIG
jgi:hypothetical protein